MFKVNLKDLRFIIWQSKGAIFVVVLASILFCVSVFRVSSAQGNNKVLGVSSKTTIIESTPTPTPSIAPTILISPKPTQLPTSTPTPTSSPTTETPNNNSSNSNSPTPTVALTPIPSPSPTPAGLGVQIGIDYAGKKSSELHSITINPGQTAWDAVVAAVGINNITYIDYGGNMGYFITALNGVAAASNEFYDFRVNGVSASVGVSSYKCSDGDKLDFVLTSF